MLLSTPLDIVAGRLAAIRLKPLPKRSLSRLLLWPSAGVALLALGWWQMHNGSGWGALLAAAATAGFAEAARLEGGAGLPGELAVISRRNAILLAVPFAVFGGWTAFLLTLLSYAAVSFFYLQHARRIASEGPS
jgi:hypothetical protein